jgi:hypothetical protein
MISCTAMQYHHNRYVFLCVHMRRVYIFIFSKCGLRILRGVVNFGNCDFCRRLYFYMLPPRGKCFLLLIVRNVDWFSYCRTPWNRSDLCFCHFEKSTMNKTYTTRLNAN